jgi:hypothetical protein
MAVPTPSRPVGRSETDSQVFACADECAEVVLAEPTAMALAIVAAQQEANAKFVKAFRMTICPPWCTEGAGHAWERHDATSVSRTHSREFVGGSSEDAEVRVDMTERLDEAGEITMLPPSVWVCDLDTKDLGVVIRVAQAVLAAAVLLRELEHARQDLESLMNTIRAGA